MAITTRQTNLFENEDWKILYQSFINTDFESYDFETMRKSMIDYIKKYYPEDFNDYIESSEFIALIDVIAYVAQNISYRVDVNARENFLSTAERRESVLRLARLVSYTPKRNLASKGLVKLQSISTTENVYDTNGVNLANTVISWNDSNNADYQEQFEAVLNAAMVYEQTVSAPNLSGTVNTVSTNQYELNLPSGTLPIYPFTASVDSTTMAFEVVSATFEDDATIEESDPSTIGTFGLLYRNDGKGNGSTNTGFFMLFKQGSLLSTDFIIDESTPNKVITVNNANINNDDVWLYELDSNNDVIGQWTQVPTIQGNSVIFNSLSKDIRTLYSVNSLENDQIAYVFGDGVFAEIPRGTFRAYFRQSNGLEYVIKSDDIQNVTINIPYISRYNTSQTLTVTFGLTQSVNNSASRESISSIKRNAPLHFYTQNRMVNGEDYNVFPLTNSTNIIKSKATNRVSSGISRFFDISDPTGKYSSTRIFADDGALTREPFTSTFSFSFSNEMDILRIIRDSIEPRLANVETLQFYFANYPQYTVNNIGWQRSTTTTNESTGYFYSISALTGTDYASASVDLGEGVLDNRKYITEGALIKFEAPSGYYFIEDGSLRAGTAGAPGTFTEKWATVISVVGDGHNGGDGNLSNGTGPVVISKKIGDGAIVAAIIPQYTTDIPTAIETSIMTKIFAHEEFAVRYDSVTNVWNIVEAADVNITGTFSLADQGDVSGNRLDRSWLIRFKSDGKIYTATYRGLKYTFESEIETSFYFDDSVRIYDSRTAETVIDSINVLKVNSKPSSNFPLEEDVKWQIYGLDVQFNGATNSRKVLVTLIDTDADGIPDNPEGFSTVVDETKSYTNTYVVYELFQTNAAEDVYEITSKPVVLEYLTEASLPADLSEYEDETVFYFAAVGVFKIYDKSNDELTTTSNFIAKQGRKDLKFGYTHNSPSDRRINPAKSNLIDMYLLTRAYSTAYKNYIQDSTGVVEEPTVSTTYELSLDFSDLLNYSMVGDEIIFHPAKYKVLFGSKADLELQATFKIVKSPTANITDTEIKTRTINAINEFFDVDNWDFGETFYFTELSAFIHQELSPYVSTVLIVPKGVNQNFGSLFEVKAQSNEIFISDAKVSDIEIIDAITATNIRSSGIITTT